MLPRTKAASLACLLLAACGGDQGSGTAAPISTSPQPTPVATPSPIVPTDVMLFDMTKDASFSGRQANAFNETRYGPGGSGEYELVTQGDGVIPDDSGVAITYQASGAISIRTGGETSSFTSADLIDRRDRGAQWYRHEYATANLDQVTLADLDERRHVGFFRQYSRREVPGPGTPAARYRDTYAFAVVGARTMSSDLPAAGVALYQTRIHTSPLAVDRNGGFYVERGELTIDHAGRTVSAQLEVSENPWQADKPREETTLLLTGEIRGTEIVGRISSPTSGYNGRFAGEFYGPNGVEFGAVLTLSRPGGLTIAGTLDGRRR